jgi:predicted Fe-Mo cluster-binding NifX family protein
MKNCKIAIPTNAPGGLEGTVSPHFGHCDGFTVVSIKDGVAVESSTLNLPEHEHGGCMIPVRMLLDAGVETVIVGGIGQRPLQGFIHFGIPVFHAGDCQQVQEVVAALGQGTLLPLAADQACGGGQAH